MKKFYVYSVLLIVTVNLNLFAQSTNGTHLYDLKYKMKKGDEFTLHNMNISNSSIKKDSVFQKEFSQTRDLILKYKVISVSDTGSVFEVEYLKKLYRWQNNQDQLTITDFSEIQGKKINYTLLENGRLTDLCGFDKLPEVTMPGDWKYSGKNFQEEIEHLLPTLPDYPVEIGYSWTRNDFGVKIEYSIMDEAKMFGFDCLRIFARISGESTSAGKDRNGNNYTMEKNEPYSDIYYFAYKEGMMIYRFSVSSLGTQVFRNDNNKVFFAREKNTLYETYITFN